MNQTITLRPTDRGDIAAIDALLARSYPALLKGDYPPSTLVTAVPLISRAQPRLIMSGTYYIAEDAAGRALGAGGWTRTRGRAATADIRHVVTNVDHVRRGVGRAILSHVFAQARAAGVLQFECMATLTALPFYRAMGFVEVGAAKVPLAPGVTFPAIRMVRSG